jgi:hypothetical protein
MIGATTFRIVTRLGFAARGLVYALIGYLALRSGRTEDPGGVMEYLASTAGRLLVAGMAAGFFAYGAWRLLEAWIDSEGHGSNRKGVGIRLTGVGSGLVHLGFAVVASRLAAGGHDNGDSSKTAAATALHLPGGALLLYLAAAILLGVGVAQFRKAWRPKFLRHLEARAAGQAWIGWLGRLGYAARGVIFALSAWLFFHAAQSHSSAAAGGIDDALGSLPRPLQMAVAAGVVLFGLFSLVEARFRRIDAPEQVSRASLKPA